MIFKHVREKSGNAVINRNAKNDEIFKKYITRERRAAQPCVTQIETGTSAKRGSELVTCEKVLSNGEKS